MLMMRYSRCHFVDYDHVGKILNELSSCRHRWKDSQLPLDHSILVHDK
jgi:hypothetical protein